MYLFVKFVLVFECLPCSGDAITGSLGVMVSAGDVDVVILRWYSKTG